MEERDYRYGIMDEDNHMDVIKSPILHVKPTPM